MLWASVIVAMGLAGPGEEVPFGGDLSKCTWVGGEEIRPELTERGWRSGDSLIDTPLPEGYPAPTAPGAIEIKRYEPVRRAEVTTDDSYGSGQRTAFFPLFEHITERDIAMTAPVEMDFPELDDGQTSGMTMAFLYRTPELGDTGEDGIVTVVDSEPQTFLSVGFRGSYSTPRFRLHLRELDAWLASQNEWVRIGDPRVLGYNGPMTPARLQWGEVQIPIAREE